MDSGRKQANRFNFADSQRPASGVKIEGVWFCRYLEEPAMIAAFSGKQAGKQVVHVACGSTYSAAITADGALYTWGRGNYGRLGHGKVWPPLVSCETRTRLWSLGVDPVYYYYYLFFPPLWSRCRLQWGPDHTHAGNRSEGAEGHRRGLWQRRRSDARSHWEWWVNPWREIVSF